MRKTSLWASLLAVAAVFLSGPVEAQRLQSFQKAQLTVEARTGNHVFAVEIARTQRQQSQGLMFRRRMAADAGMIFIHPGARPISMWMRNTFIPLDMLFIAADGRIIRIAERTVPQSLEAISSGGPALAVLEVNAGTVSRLKIQIGDRITSPAFGR